jgi:hypothetical protein
MATAAYAAAVFALVAVLGSAVFLGVRALSAWRSFRRFTAAAGQAVESLLRSAEAAEAHATAAGAGAERLAAATARLQTSLVRLSLLQSATGEFRATLARLRGVVPTK